MFDPEVFFPVLERIANLLKRCGLRYQLTGGLVSIYYAEPRLTQDADLVVDPNQLRASVDQFVDGIQKLGYVSNEATIRDAVKRGRMFQVIDSEECLKVDLYPREIVDGALDQHSYVSDCRKRPLRSCKQLAYRSICDVQSLVTWTSNLDPG